jgi:hypothetical protein
VLRVDVHGNSISSTNVPEHAPLSARVSVDLGTEVETTGEHENRAADRGCVSRLVRCSSSGTSGDECSLEADRPESAPLQECPGHPEAEPPAHGRGWPPTARPDPISHVTETDSESYRTDRRKTPPTEDQQSQ